MMRTKIALVLTLAFAVSCMNPNRKEGTPGKVAEPPAATGPMTITSPAFADNGTIPQKYTCNGTAVSPEIDFTNVPQTALSMALEVTDPDAPGGTFTHWLVWDIPTTVTRFKEDDVPAGVIQGLNGFGKNNYGSPCPPSGVHHYLFDLYALDNTLGLAASKGREDFENAIKGHVVAHARLTGLYGK
jgi:Raf kinase inhibitor-like YbhB/YbcL family protein